MQQTKRRRPRINTTIAPHSLQVIADVVREYGLKSDGAAIDRIILNLENLQWQVRPSLVVTVEKLVVAVEAIDATLAENS